MLFKFENLRAVTASANSRNQRKNLRNKTGVVGVAYLKKKNAYIGYYYDLNRRLVQKQFSCSSMGKIDAFVEAIRFRREGIEKMNALGAGYTEAHINR